MSEPSDYQASGHDKRKTAFAARWRAVEHQVAVVFAAALGQVRSGEVAAGVEGLEAMDQLVEQHPSLRSRVVSEICALLRKPYDTADLASRSVRIAAQKVLRKQLTRGQSELEYWETDSVKLAGAVFIDLDLSGCRVAAATFTGAVFEGSTDFTCAQFQREAGFDGVEFHGPVRFARAWFWESVDFAQARFAGPAWFRRARFDREAVFDGAEFADTARFDDTEFPDYAWFNDTHFHGDADFAGATFDGDPIFEHTSFEPVAAGKTVTVTGGFHFIDMTFHKGVPCR